MTMGTKPMTSEGLRRPQRVFRRSVKEAKGRSMMPSSTRATKANAAQRVATTRFLST